MPFRKPAWSSFLLIGCGLVLALSNPPIKDYRLYAGRKFSHLLSQKLCIDSHFKMLSTIVGKDCEVLVTAQQPVFEYLTEKFTTRTNYVFFSIYQTQIGGDALIPNLLLPTYQFSTFAFVGQFFTFDYQTDQADFL